jgi:hypothetical protein
LQRLGGRRPRPQAAQVADLLRRDGGRHDRLRRRSNSGPATPLQALLDRLALLGVQTAQLILHVEAKLLTHVEQVFALHVQLLGQRVNADSLCLLQALPLLS